MRDPYETLGVGRSATETEIRSAFRKLAAEHHPDRNPGDPAAQTRFTELNAAYQILSDSQKRAAFDRFGPSIFDRTGGAPDFSDLGSLGLDGIFGDLLGAFGIRTGDRGDLRQRLSITFEEAVLGCSKDVTYQRLDACKRCSGSGGEPGTRVSSCGACGGRGKVRFQQGVLPLAIERPCSACRGTGRVPLVPCSECTGKGLVTVSRTLEVAIPAGVEDGATRVIEGGGSRTRADKPAGDLEILVQVQPHPFFKRDGDDLVCSVPISFVTAALGGEIEVPSLTGKAKVRVPPATQPGSVLRMKGKGAPHRYRGGRGDQLVEVALEVPTELTPRARQLIEELGAELGEDVQPQQRTFVEKLRGLFG
ncbi:MAG TPA: molecular chaperone DnaJ [Polyangiaceae bacterium]|nr:molecular chaperone DnaJ [Polyangiaceae bacterium]